MFLIALYTFPREYDGVIYFILQGFIRLLSFLARSAAALRTEEAASVFVYSTSFLELSEKQ